MPRNRLAFAVGVGGQQHAVGLRDGGLEFGQHALPALGRLIGQLERRRFDAQLFRRQVTHMANAGHDLVAVAENRADFAYFVR